MKIFIDDERNPTSHGWTVVRTGAAYLDLLYDGFAPIITALSFDHDLGDPNAPDGYRLVKDTVDYYFKRPDRFRPGLPIVLHTANPIGQRNMKQYLEFSQKHGAFPGSTFMINYANMMAEPTEKS